MNWRTELSYNETVTLIQQYKALIENGELEKADEIFN